MTNNPLEEERKKTEKVIKIRRMIGWTAYIFMGVIYLTLPHLFKPFIPEWAYWVALFFVLLAITLFKPK